MRSANAALTGGSLLGVLLVAVGLGTSTSEPVLAQAGTRGSWRTLTNRVPINPVHAALLRNGQVLMLAGSGNVATETNFQATVWDPATETFLTQSLNWDMFCNGMVTLHDGRVLVNGGNLQYDPFFGQPRNAVFDPATGLFTDVQNMARGRWYPTVTTLGDGRVMTFSGLLEVGGTNTSVEIYTVGSGWSQQYAAGWTPPLYPRMHLSTDGRVFYAGSTRSSRFFTPSTGAWSAIVATTNHSASRTYGTSVLLPLTPANGYRPRVMIFGGGNPATPTTEIIDLSAPTPQWQFGPPMTQPRIQMNATILPNGKVLATGGSTNDEDALTASFNADLYDPVANTFSSAGANAFPRLYHSNALLLPDATVLLMGGNPQRGNYESRLEIYSPAYLFNGDGTAALRPSITGMPQETVNYNLPFTVQTPEAADIASVVLVRPGTPTHAFDMDQRLVGLSFTAGSGVLNVTAPPNGNIAPPGYYMLFVLNSAGVPSVARFVRLVTAPANQAPVATITSPTGNVTVNPGQNVSFSGAGIDTDGSISAHSWTFPGGVPGSSSVAVPGGVTYSTPGSYAASFTVTDDKGLASPPATRTVTVSNFTLAATPASQAVTVGQNATYTATVTPVSGFTGTVDFTVTGLPSGAAGTFTPASVTGSGSAALLISTAGVASGSYPLVIGGTSGPISRTANVTLTINAANQAPVASITSPASNVTVNPGGTVAFSGNGTDSDGSVTAFGWTFAGGAPGSSSVAAPGHVSYSTPGSYAASLTVTDDEGLASSPTTRTVTVSNFTLTATPAAQTVMPGQNATYSATVTPVSGFTGTVDFTVTGLPSGAVGTLTPTSVAGSGTTTLLISTTGVLPGSYPLVIRGSSGPISRSVNVTLTINGDFTISATPSSRTVGRGGSATYTVSISAGPGFSGPVSLTVDGLPSRTTAAFTPASVAGSGTSVLTVTTARNSQKGTRTLTITGTGGGRTHSVNVTVAVQ